MKNIYLILTILLLSVRTFAALSDLDKADLSSTNILKNPGFESGFAGWTKTGGTWTLQTSGSKLGFGKNSLCWDSNAAGQKLKSPVTTVPNALKGKNGESRLSILTPTGTSTHKFRSTDGTNQLGNYLDVFTSSTSFQLHSVNMILPTTGGVAMEIESVASNEPEICVDIGYIGEATNLQNVAQAKHVGTLKYVGATSCQWANATTGSWVSFSADTDCNTPSVTGSLEAPATKLPAFKMNAQAGGIYRVTAKGLFENGVGTGISKFRLNDGTDSTELCGLVRPLSGTDIGNASVVSCLYAPTTAGSKTIEFQMFSTTSGGAITNNSSDLDLVFEVEQIPSQSQIAVNSLQTDYGPIDLPSVAAGTWLTALTTNPTYGAVTVNKGTQEKTGKYLTINWHYEHTTAGTAGSGRYLLNLPAGLEIDMAEYGLADSFVDTGFYKAAKVGTMMVSHNNTNSDQSVAGDILIYDKTRVYVIMTYNGSPSVTIDYWDVSYPMSYADMSITANFKVPIKGWVKSQPSPTLANSLNTSSESAYRTDVGFITNPGTPVLSENSDSGWTLTDNGAGDVTINIPAGRFSSIPVCNVTLYANLAGSSDLKPTISARSTTAIRVFIHNNANTGFDWDFNLSCMGKR